MILFFSFSAGALALQTSPAASGLENCYAVRATADARNRAISTERAERRLHHHIAHEMRSPGGKSVGPVRSTASATLRSLSLGLPSLIADFAASMGQ